MWPWSMIPVLGGEEDRHPLLGGEPPHLIPERGAALDVEPGRRLVEEEDARPVGKRQRQVQTPLHPA